MSRRVLFTCWPFEGHVFPLLSIALAAREDGAEVAFPRGNIRRAKLVLTDELIAATAAPRKEN